MVYPVEFRYCDFFRFNCETKVAASTKAIFRIELAYIAYYCLVNQYNMSVSSLVLNGMTLDSR